MSNLLKHDMLRMLKSKQFLIAVIIAASFAVILPLITLGLNTFMESVLGEDLEEAGSLFPKTYAKDFMFINSGFMTVTGMSSMVNISFILNVILFSVVITKDFSYGTIRNKIITGNSRINVYFSLFITMYVFMFGTSLATSLLGFGVSCLMFDIGIVGSASEIVGTLVLSFIFYALIYFFFVSFICFFAIGMGKIALGIVFTFVLGFFGFLIPVIGQLVSNFATSAAEAGSFDVNLAEMINNVMIALTVNDIHYMPILLSPNGYKYYEIIAMITTPLLFGMAYTGLGLVLFNKRNLK